MKKKKKEEVVEEIKIPDGLYQSFMVPGENKMVVLKDLLTEKDWWILKSRKRETLIVTHDAVKKVADSAKILTDVKYDFKIHPNSSNNYLTVVECTICDGTGRCTTEIGESSRDNLGSRGRQNPVNMAQKRAYDRAVFRHLGITGLLEENELPDEEEQDGMDRLSPDEAKQVAEWVNKIIGAKNK